MCFLSEEVGAAMGHLAFVRHGARLLILLTPPVVYCDTCLFDLLADGLLSARCSTWYNDTPTDNSEAWCR